MNKCVFLKSFYISIYLRDDMVEEWIEVKTQLGSHAELQIARRSHFARFQIIINTSGEVSTQIWGSLYLI